MGPVAGVLELGLPAHGWAWLTGAVLGIADDAARGVHRCIIETKNPGPRYGTGSSRMGEEIGGIEGSRHPRQIRTMRLLRLRGLDLDQSKTPGTRDMGPSRLRSQGARSARTSVKKDKSRYDREFASDQVHGSNLYRGRVRRQAR